MANVGGDLKNDRGRPRDDAPNTDMFPLQL